MLDAKDGWIPIYAALALLPMETSVWSMGILHVCDKQKNIIFVVWDGRVTADDWFNQAPKLMAEPDWPYISRVIGDVQTASDTASIGDKEVEVVAALFGTRPEAMINKKLAVLADDQFGKARKFVTLLSRYGTSAVVFNGLDTACIFLGIDPIETGEMLEQIRLRLRSDH
jgi:hypothetical protein